MSFRNLTVIGLIPARSGSKGIPQKNLVPVLDKPLIQHSIEAGLCSTTIDRVIVSSDGEETLNISKKLGAEVIHRPKNISLDTSSINTTIEHAISKLSLEDAYIVLLQPTSPLRTHIHIDNAFDELNKTQSKNLISVYKPKHHPYKSYILNADHHLKGLIDDESPHKNRQELPEVYYPNGAIYLFTIKDFAKNNCIPTNEVASFLMPEAISIDIDEPNDITLIENTMKNIGECHVSP